jgi:hypothetical protein
MLEQPDVVNAALRELVDAVDDRSDAAPAYPAETVAVRRHVSA